MLPPLPGATHLHDPGLTLSCQFIHDLYAETVQLPQRTMHLPLLFQMLSVSHSSLSNQKVHLFACWPSVPHTRIHSLAQSPCLHRYLCQVHHPACTSAQHMRGGEHTPASQRKQPSSNHQWVIWAKHGDAARPQGPTLPSPLVASAVEV